MISRVATSSFTVPILHRPIELSARDKKVLAVAIGTLLLFGLQLGFSLSATFAISFLATTLTYLAEKYLRTEPHQQTDWFNTNFNKKVLIFWIALYLLSPFILQAVFGALGTPLPPHPQTGLVKALFAHPWKMIPLITIVAPFTEEILFRGFLLERFEDLAQLWSQHISSLSQKTQNRLSNTAQALLFGAAHLRSEIEKGMHLPLFLFLSLSGYWSGLSKQKDQTLLSPMAYHSASNIGATTGIFLSH